MVSRKSTHMALVAQGKVREFFTHQQLGSFDVTAMRMAAQNANRELMSAAIDRAMIEFIKTSRDVEPARVSDLTDEQFLNDPALVVLDPEGMHLLIDGSHRITRRALEGHTSFEFWLFGWHEIIRPKPGTYLDLQWGNPDFDKPKEGKV